jgi:hypothetical protein
MMRCLALLGLAVGLVACGHGRRLTATGTPGSLPFSQEWALFTQSRFRATYDLEASNHGKTVSWQIAWYKDGVVRQRLDLSGADLASYLGHVTIFIDGDQITFCGASGTHPDPQCVQGHNASEVAVFLLLSRGFGLELLPPEAQGALVAGDGQSETISGHPASCYSARDATPAASSPETPESTTKLCFSPTGVLLKREGPGSGGISTFTITGGVSSPSNGDFALPYALTTEPTP